MPGFRNVREYTEAQRFGRFSSCSLRKVPSQASTAGWWVDLSMAAGNPVPNYYASSPLVAATLDGFRGVFHGDAKVGQEKYLTEWMLVTPTAGLVGRYMLLDYLIYYPFVDLDDADAQVMDNTVTLPRYEDGIGVQAMLVAAAPTTGNGTFTFDYINQDGVARTSVLNRCATAATAIATLLTTEPATAAANGPFLRLADGDTGIRQITGWTNSVLNGGLGTVVLVKPLADLPIREINTPSEITFVERNPVQPRILDGAYLNMIMNCAATVAAGQLAGRLNFAWTSGE